MEISSPPKISPRSAVKIEIFKKKSIAKNGLLKSYCSMKKRNEIDSDNWSIECQNLAIFDNSEVIDIKKYCAGIYPLVYALIALEDHHESSRPWSL